MTLRTLLLAATLTVAASVVPLAAPAQAAPTCDGVWIVVDPGNLGGASQRCAEFAGDPYPVSGQQVLDAAGHAVTYVGTTTFVCRIDGRPASDPCTRTPPANAYWSYWVADAGGTWRQSSQGAASSRRVEGQADGWVFGDGSRPPSFAPPPPAPEPAPEPAETAEPDPAPSGSTSDADDEGAGHDTSDVEPNADPSTDVPEVSDSPTDDSRETDSTDRDVRSAASPDSSPDSTPGDATSERDSPGDTGNNGAAQDEEDADANGSDAPPSADRRTDGPATGGAAPGSSDDGTAPAGDEGSDPEALATRATSAETDPTIGLLVGGLLLASLAALTVVQVIRRRTGT